MSTHPTRDLAYEAPRARTPYALGTLVLVSSSRRTGYLLSYLVSYGFDLDVRGAYLRVERVDLSRQEPVGLLGVWVVDKVVFDLLGLSHLIVSMGLMVLV